jgi:hypothetical protein
VLGEKLTSQVTFSPFAWRRGWFATAITVIVTNLRSVCAPFPPWAAGPLALEGVDSVCHA